MLVSINIVATCTNIILVKNLEGVCNLVSITNCSKIILRTTVIIYSYKDSSLTQELEFLSLSRPVYKIEKPSNSKPGFCPRRLPKLENFVFSQL